jgi:hypothetical protein
MKIAVASEGKMVTEHFGHCEGFTIFEAENKQIRTSNLFRIPDTGQDSCRFFCMTKESRSSFPAVWAEARLIFSMKKESK